jgi:uncharacterized protein
MIMAQTAQQHEPTMEEILASIRRIIEDNNAYKDDTNIAHSAPQFSQNQPALVSDISKNIARFEREFAAADVFKTEQNYVSVQERNHPQNEPLAHSLAMSSHENLHPSFQNHRITTASSAPLRASVPTSSEAQEIKVKPYGSVETQVVAAPSNTQVGSFIDSHPIISEQIGRQVAHSFEHLSAILMKERNSSIFQITQDLLYPLLKEWLENNLPRVVETLVREEIERVSRGIR